MAIPDELLADLEQEEDSSEEAAAPVEEAAEPVEQVVGQERPVDDGECRSYPSRCAFGTHELPSSKVSSVNTRSWSCLLQHARHLTLQLQARKAALVARKPDGTSYHGTSLFRPI